jgi:hypothetical protein
MKRKGRNNLSILFFTSVIFLCGTAVANAQIQAAGGGYYVAGYGTVYGSFGQASAAQSRLYDKMRASSNVGGQTAAGSPATPTSRSSAAPRPVIRNNGLYRTDSTVDTGKALADGLANTPEENALIRQIYTAAKAAYETEAASRGWKNNIAAGLTFFTVAAMTVYRDAGEPSDSAVVNYFKTLNSALDETPEFAQLSNKDKQGFNNVLVGFGGILLAGYNEAKQNNDAEALSASKKLAGMLIQMVLKTDPENLRIEDDQIVMK